MKHPKTRAERRSVRDGYIARRKFIAQHIWYQFEKIPHEGDPEYPPIEWGKYAKFNLNCGCKDCHSDKYYKEKRKRRRALDQALIDNLRSFEEQY